MGEHITSVEETERRRLTLQEGEPAVIAAFVAVAVIWTGFILAATGREICLRRLMGSLVLAAAAGLVAGAIREVTIARHP